MLSRYTYNQEKGGRNAKNKAKLFPNCSFNVEWIYLFTDKRLQTVVFRFNKRG
jgi:hypothetical protein